MNKLFSKFKDAYSKRPIIGSLFVFFLVFLFASIACFASSGSTFLDDHFFHFKYAYLLRTHGFGINNHFDWFYLAGTIIYKASLFQIALIPFTYIKDLAVGLKISDIFWASASLGIIYYSFRKLKVSPAFLLVLAIVCFNSFMPRFLVGRALVLAIGLIFLLIYFAIHKKYYKFFIVSLIYVFWHQTTFFMPLVIAGIVEVSRYMSFKRANPKAIMASLVSMFLAALYFSFQSFADLFSFLRDNAYQANLGEGAEIYKKDIFQIMSSSDGFLLILFISFAFVFYVYLSNRDIPEEERPRSIINVYTAFLFLLMSLAGSILASGRFFDYYGVGVVFLIGSCFAYIKDKNYSIDENLSKFLVGGILVFLLVAGTSTFINVKKVTYNNDLVPIEKVTKWIASKSSNKDKVYPYDWGTFNTAFFYNDKNIYAMGLEPRATINYNEKLYWKWYNIFNYGIYCDRNEDCADQLEEYSNYLKNADEEGKKALSKENGRKIVESIKNDFGAKYVIASDNQSAVFRSNDDLIADSFSAKSEINGGTLWGYELK